MSTVHRIVAACAAAIGAVALSACAAHPGVALSVDGRTYTEAEIDEGIAQYSQMLGKHLDRPQFVLGLPATETMTRAAESMGVAATVEEIDAFVAEKQAEGTIGPIDGEISSTMYDILGYLLNSERVNAAAAGMSADEIADLQARINEISSSQRVEVNPRYGTIDEALGKIVAPRFGDVVDLSSFADAGDGADDRPDGGR
ncbi:hypothetical protein M3T53_08295 [Actinomyces sp. B33]|uniref:hypothetical protein n=1 Tax=Actinomyces sp. B33 TaxID=2942131 RepID=UPI002341DF71|nr:hypothetical protein [Actinomyces sp. B33]MDC4233704.1 hypothetical protein [Actinomyces sp. B33]